MAKARRVVGALNWGMAALFAVAAAMQVNDPDPAAWVAIYAAAAVACLLHGRVSRGWAAQGAVGAIALFWAAALLARLEGPVELGEVFDLGAEMMGETTELLREAGGLLLLALWMAILAAVGWRGRAGRA